MAGQPPLVPLTRSTRRSSDSIAPLGYPQEQGKVSRAPQAQHVASREEGTDVINNPLATTSTSAVPSDNSDGEHVCGSSFLTRHVANVCDDRDNTVGHDASTQTACSTILRSSLTWNQEPQTELSSLRKLRTTAALVNPHSTIHWITTPLFGKRHASLILLYKTIANVSCYHL
jgi:hypothetical protein